MLTDSEVLITGGTFYNVSPGGTAVNYTNASTLSGGQGFELLLKHVSPNALHNSGDSEDDQPTCHPGTRVAILDHLTKWATEVDYPHLIKWLHGPAGGGKTAILRTTARRLFEMKLLAASFFFFRAGAGRNSAQNVVATIAYQLATNIPATRQRIVQAIEQNPLLFSLTLADQVQALIVDPLNFVCNEPTSSNSSPLPRIFILDGLDECRDSAVQCQILEVLCAALHILPIPFALLIASRPEHHIRGAFDLGLLNTASSRLALDNSFKPDEDIRRYYLDKFRKIQQHHPFKDYLPSSQSWPQQEVIDKLVDKASGQFIYASTVVKFVSSIRQNPSHRLDIILGSIDAGALKPFEQLDCLYSTIFLTVDSGDLVATLRILGALLVPQSRSSIGAQSQSCPRFLELLLGLEKGEVRRLLFDLESLLSVRRDDEGISIFHASLPDFLFDKSRSTQFFVDAGMVYSDLSKQCLSRLTLFNGTANLKYVTENISLFLAKAIPTLELQEIVHKVEIGKLVNFIDHTDHPAGLLFLCPYFLDGIKLSAFPDGEDLYAQMLRVYKKNLDPIIAHHFSNQFLKCYLIIMIMIVGKDNRYTTGIFLRRIFGLSPGAMDVEFWDPNFSDPRQRRRRRIRSMDILQETLIPFMQEIFCDPQSRYTVKGTDYADVTLEFLMGWFQPQNIRKMLHGRGRDSDFVIYISVIFPELLARSATSSDLILFIDDYKVTITSQFEDYPNIVDAIKAYANTGTARGSGIIGWIRARLKAYAESRRRGGRHRMVTTKFRK